MENFLLKKLRGASLLFGFRSGSLQAGYFCISNRVRPGIKSDEEALHTAFTEIVSGRAPEARGNGLKFVREVVLNNTLKLCFYSGSAEAVIDGDTKKVKFNKTDIYYSGCLALITF